MEGQMLFNEAAQQSCRSQLQNVSAMTSLDLSDATHPENGLSSAYTTRLNYMQNHTLSDGQEKFSQLGRDGKDSPANKMYSLKDPFAQGDFNGATGNSGLDLRSLDPSSSQANFLESGKSASSGATVTAMSEAFPDMVGLSLSSATQDDVTPPDRYANYTPTSVSSFSPSVGRDCGKFATLQCCAFFSGCGRLVSTTCVSPASRIRATAALR
jgi:hypothetical protein